MGDWVRIRGYIRNARTGAWFIASERVEKHLKLERIIEQRTIHRVKCPRRKLTRTTVRSVLEINNQIRKHFLIFQSINEEIPTLNRLTNRRNSRHQVNAQTRRLSGRICVRRGEEMNAMWGGEKLTEPGHLNHCSDFGILEANWMNYIWMDSATSLWRHWGRSWNESDISLISTRTIPTMSGRQIDNRRKKSTLSERKGRSLQ